MFFYKKAALSVLSGHFLKKFLANVDRMCKLTSKIPCRTGLSVRYLGLTAIAAWSVQASGRDESVCFSADPASIDGTFAFFAVMVPGQLGCTVIILLRA